MPYTLEGFSHWLVEWRGNAFAEVARLLAHEPLPAVFFCSSGKNRTGMLAGILQSALGMTDADVIAEYAETERRLPESYYVVALARSRRAGLPEGAPEQGLGSPPDLMAEVLAGVAHRHGGARGYQLDHGLAAVDLALLAQRLTDV